MYNKLSLSLSLSLSYSLSAPSLTTPPLSLSRSLCTLPLYLLPLSFSLALLPAPLPCLLLPCEFLCPCTTPLSVPSDHAAPLIHFPRNASFLSRGDLDPARVKSRVNHTTTSTSHQKVATHDCRIDTN